MVGVVCAEWYYNDGICFTNEGMLLESSHLLNHFEVSVLYYSINVFRSSDSFSSTLTSFIFEALIEESTT